MHSLTLGCTTWATRHPAADYCAGCWARAPRRLIYWWTMWVRATGYFNGHFSSKKQFHSIAIPLAAPAAVECRVPRDASCRDQLATTASFAGRASSPRHDVDDRVSAVVLACLKTSYPRECSETALPARHVGILLPRFINISSAAGHYRHDHQRKNAPRTAGLFPHIEGAGACLN